MNRLRPLFLLLVILPFGAYAQVDTLRVMTYNLTNYGNPQTGCTSANNGPAVKNPEFKNIMKYVKPDILNCNELNTNPAYATGFLANVLNTDGVTSYKRSASVVEGSGTLTSMIFYNSDKLVLAQQFSVPTTTRLTPHCRFYLKTNELATGDTIWINTLSTHLKAGTASTDQAERGNMTNIIRNYLNSWPKKENFMILGDFNVYRSSEQAWINLTSTGTQAAFQFLDPVNRVGTWTANASFADVHTQCPRTDNNGGCYSGGGMDDRFDYILMNRHLLNDSAKVKYVTTSYRAVGNDGQHYNKAITASPTNNSVPASVLNSLFIASDHLPVMAKLRVSASFMNATKHLLTEREIKATWSERGIYLSTVIGFPLLTLSLLNIQGQKLAENQVIFENGETTWNPGTLASGMYILKVSTPVGNAALRILKE